MKDIDFTFGLITDGLPASCDRLTDIVESIHALNIPNYEVIIVGPKDNVKSYFTNPLVKVIDFDDSIRAKWITKKKNVITQNALYDNIVYSHDYIVYDPNWYAGWQEFGDNYHACMNRIENFDGTRFRDWNIYDHWELPEFAAAATYAGFNRAARECLIPYGENELQRFQYFSGTYWVAKKSIMQEIPQPEHLVWGQGEDLVWSSAFRRKYRFSLNEKSTVRIHKSSTHHQLVFAEMRPEVLTKMKEFIRGRP
jgi:hypothetical protein